MIKKIADGDRDALCSLYNAVGRDIYAFLLTFCRNRHTAEDILQDTFISVFENAGRFRVYKNPRAWIITIAKNKALNRLRLDSRAAAEIDEDLAAEGAAPDDEVADRIYAGMLLSVLSGEERKIVILHAVYGLKHRETAKMLGLPLGTITRKYKECIEKMKQKSCGEISGTEKKHRPETV